MKAEIILAVNSIICPIFQFSFISPQRSKLGIFILWMFSFKTSYNSPMWLWLKNGCFLSTLDMSFIWVSNQEEKHVNENAYQIIQSICRQCIIRILLFKIKRMDLLFSMLLSGKWICRFRFSTWFSSGLTI